jgi:hypothetical protein
MEIPMGQYAVDLPLYGITVTAMCTVHCQNVHYLQPTLSSKYTP